MATDYCVAFVHDNWNLETKLANRICDVWRLFVLAWVLQVWVYIFRLQIDDFFGLTHSLVCPFFFSAELNHATAFCSFVFISVLTFSQFYFFCIEKPQLTCSGSVAFSVFHGFVSRFCFYVYSCVILVPGLCFCFLFLAACQVLIFFAYIVYIYKLYINTYIYYLILSLLQICMFPGFVFCASYARAHVYGSRFAISAMKARTHFCVFNGVVFSVDGCFLVLVRLRAVSCVSACDTLLISTEVTSLLFSFLSGSSILMFNLHIVTPNYGAEASFSLFQLCFFMFFNSIIGTFVPFIALFGRCLLSKSTTLEACFVIYAIWSWVSRPPAW